MKSTIVYIGNQLAPRGLNPTSIDTLGERLKEDFIVIKASSQRWHLSKFFDMMFTIIRNRFLNPVVLIDTYSTNAFYFGFASGLLCQILNLRYIPILHGGDLPRRFRNSPKLSRLFLGKASKVVSPSHYLLEETRSILQIQSCILPNSIVIQHYEFKPKRGEGVKLLWLRALQEIYNPQMALELVRYFKTNTNLEVHLHMVGGDKGGLIHALKEKAIDLNIEDCVTFHGQLPKENWLLIAEQCSYFINTSNFDNTPISMIEAMALGLPVITTNAGGISRLIDCGEDGFIVEKNDSISMALRIMQLLSNDELKVKIVKNARLKAEKNDWKVISKQWKNLIDEISK